MNETIAWINGSFCRSEQAAVPVWDLGVVAGASVTEMARTFAHKPFRLEEHIKRLTGSLTALGFPQVWTPAALLGAARSVVAHNIRLIAPGQDLGMVLFSTAGSNPTYLSGAVHPATTVIHTFLLPLAQWKPSLQNGVRLRIPDVRQIPDDCFPVGHKVRNRLHWWLADQQATKIEPGSKALLPDHEGFVTETSASCFYIVRDGRIATSNRGVLNSKSCEVVEQLAASLDIPFERRGIRVEELDSATEAFLSSTPVGLLPVSHIDGRQVGGEAAGIDSAESVCARLLHAWSKLVGLDIAAQILQS